MPIQSFDSVRYRLDTQGELNTNVNIASYFTHKDRQQVILSSFSFPFYFTS